MASSRIFVRNLPPNLGEDEFKKHFSKFGLPTDSRLLGARRIGYVGFKTPDDAARAVKYFNKSFIRMSRINVEIARPATDDIPSEKHRHQLGPKQPEAYEHEEGEHGEPQSLKRKRDSAHENPTDPKLQEFLSVMQKPSKSKAWMNDDIAHEANTVPIAKRDKAEYSNDEAPSDDEYQSMSHRSKRPKEHDKFNPPATVKHKIHVSTNGNSSGRASKMLPEGTLREPSHIDRQETDNGDSIAEHSRDANIADDDWVRSRTNRTLDLVEDDYEESACSEQREDDKQEQEPIEDGEKAVDSPREPLEPMIEQKKTRSSDEDPIRESRRLFLRNLSYVVTEDDLRERFSLFGELTEVHVPIDTSTGKAKGFAYVEFADGDAAVKAYKDLDSQIFQGRLLHVLPAEAKRGSRLDEFTISKLPLKVQRQIQRKAQASSSAFNWNSLYMSADAVLSSTAARLGIDKSDVLDATSSDAAVKQAIAETHIIQDTKNYFAQHNVDLEAFKTKRRGDIAILVKNFPFETKAEELRKMFEDFGTVMRFLMPPTGTIAIVEFSFATEARAAFKALAYRKIKDSILFLEWAPKDLFKEGAVNVDQMKANAISAKPTAADLLEKDPDNAALNTSTLFVRNLSFATTTEKLKETFSSLAGFLSARVKTKTDPKKPGQFLSMGFGFIEFRTKAEAQTALAVMNGHVLDGYKLDVRGSQKALDAAEERRKEDRAKALAGRRSKIIIKNLPFEASKKEVRALFAAYGQLRTVRVPKKFDSSSRGFAFAEYMSPREAANAMDALRNTHLLGRRLVLEFAEEEPEDAEAEIERMQQKIGGQTNKVALRKLADSGRKKFNVDVSGGAQEDT